MRLLTAEEVAEKLRVKVSWVQERCRERTPAEQRIPFIKLPGGRYVRFVETQIDAWMANGCKPVEARK
jgi:excisionase family DNA binding protein